MLPIERVLLSAVGALVLLMTLGGLAGLRLNLSPSVKGLVFWIDDGQAIRVDDYVSFCLPRALDAVPEMATATVPVCMQDQRGAPLLKRVASIDDRGALYLVGEHPKSLDSRMFGWIDSEAIKHRLVRVW